MIFCHYYCLFSKGTHVGLIEQIELGKFTRTELSRSANILRFRCHPLTINLISTWFNERPAKSVKVPFTIAPAWNVPEASGWLASLKQNVISFEEKSGLPVLPCVCKALERISQSEGRERDGGKEIPFHSVPNLTLRWKRAEIWLVCPADVFPSGNPRAFGIHSKKKRWRKEAPRNSFSFSFFSLAPLFSQIYRGSDKRLVQSGGRRGPGIRRESAPIFHQTHRWPGPGHRGKRKIRGSRYVIQNLF